MGFRQIRLATIPTAATIHRQVQECLPTAGMLPAALVESALTATGQVTEHALERQNE